MLVDYAEVGLGKLLGGVFGFAEGVGIHQSEDGGLSIVELEVEDGLDSVVLVAFNVGDLVDSLGHDKQGLTVGGAEFEVEVDVLGGGEGENLLEFEDDVVSVGGSNLEVEGVKPGAGFSNVDVSVGDDLGVGSLEDCLI